MHVRIVYLGRIRTVTGSREEVAEVVPGSTVGTMLEELAARHGDEFRKLVFDGGELAPGFNVLVDGLNVTKGVLNRDNGPVASLPDKEVQEPEVELVLLDAPFSGG